MNLNGKIHIRRATSADAEAMVAILTAIAAEEIHTAISRPWSVVRQQEYLDSLSNREIVFIAESEAGEIAGYQTLDLWASTLDSMLHVGQIGTFLKPAWRRRGIGEALFGMTLEFALAHEFAKFVIQVRAGNNAALEFYRKLGFRACGRLGRQVRIGGREEDEILMELFLNSSALRQHPLLHRS